jgi:hypothetical protein
MVLTVWFLPGLDAFRTFLSQIVEIFIDEASKVAQVLEELEGCDRI